jgi:hypothetical protein
MHFFQFTGYYYSATLPAIRSSSFLWTGDRRTSFYHPDTEIFCINFPFLIKKDLVFVALQSAVSPYSVKRDV